MIRLLVTVSAVLLALSSTQPRAARADSLRSVFDRGNEAYFKGDFERALTHYDALVAAGVRDADVAFNMGTAHAAMGHYGQAIRQFEKALKHRAGFEEAERSLRDAQQLLGQRQAERSGEATVQTAPALTDALVRPFTQDGLAWGLLFAMLGTCGCLLALFHTRGETVRISLGLGACVLGVLTLALTMGLAIKAEWGRAGQRAIVLSEDAAVLQGPDRNAAVQRSLPEGTPVRWLGKQAGFARVRTAEGQLGWMAQGDVGEI